MIVKGWKTLNRGIANLQGEPVVRQADHGRDFTRIERLVLKGAQFPSTVTVEEIQELCESLTVQFDRTASGEAVEA